MIRLPCKIPTTCRIYLISLVTRAWAQSGDTHTLKQIPEVPRPPAFLLLAQLQSFVGLGLLSHTSRSRLCGTSTKPDSSFPDFPDFLPRKLRIARELQGEHPSPSLSFGCSDNLEAMGSESRNPKALLLCLSLAGEWWYVMCHFPGKLLVHLTEKSEASTPVRGLIMTSRSISCSRNQHHPGGKSRPCQRAGLNGFVLLKAGPVI